MFLGNMRVLSAVSSFAAFTHIFVRQEMGAEGHLAQSFAGENKPKFTIFSSATWKENFTKPLNPLCHEETNQTMLSMLSSVFC